MYAKEVALYFLDGEPEKSRLAQGLVVSDHVGQNLLRPIHPLGQSHCEVAETLIGHYVPKHLTEGHFDSVSW